MPTRLWTAGRHLHALDLTIDPRVVRLGQAMFNPIFCADALEQMKFPFFVPDFSPKPLLGSMGTARLAAPSVRADRVSLEL